VLIESDGAGRLSRVSVTIGGMGTAPVRAREVEQAIIGQVPTGELFRAACESCRKLEAIDDVHAPASYRQHLAAVLSRRALGEGACAPARCPSGAAALEHDPEKWMPVFGKDHAPTKG
jgi:carbon-monoxide dehydrogenase medium subunit